MISCVPLNDIHPLVIPVTPFRGESLIGLLARATDENVLGHPRILLEEIGAGGNRPGTIGIHADKFSDRLALKLGCNEAEIIARAHPATIAENGAPNAILRFGSGEVIRGDLELIKRRISPISLESGEYHRSHWLNRLLPFCPESLELLVDRCHCGAELGWVRTLGVSRCETCGERVRNLEPHYLPGNLRRDYDFFARLVSADIEEQRTVLDNLNPDIASFPAGLRINLILRLGSICHEPHLSIRRTAAHNLAPETLAKIACLGTHMLRNWPHNLRETIGETLAYAFEADGDQHAKVVHSLQTLAQAQYFRAETRDLINAVLPEAASRRGVALSRLLQPVMQASEACRLTSVSTSKLHLLRDAGVISYVKLGGRTRMIAQYDRREILELAEWIRKSRSLLTAAASKGLPEYALEQLICLGHMAEETHPAIGILYDRPRCTGASFDSFFANVEHAARTDIAPETAVPLATAMRILGGAAKPWGAILAAISDKKMPVWTSGNGKLARKLVVEPNALRSLASSAFVEADHPTFQFGLDFPQVDVAEILNISWDKVFIVEHEGLLHFRQDGPARYASRSQVLEVASRYVATSEAASRIGCGSLQVRRIMRDHPEVVQRAAGWDRTGFDLAFGHGSTNVIAV